MKKFTTLLAFAFYLTSNAQIITTVAGNGTAGFLGDGGAATAAELHSAYGTCFDAAGNLYIADALNNRIRVVNTAGIISTYAGTGTAGYSGDGGQATAAKLSRPTDLACDAAGNLYISDEVNNVVRKITTTGIISTYGGTGVSGYTGDGGQATAAELSYVNTLSIDNVGNIYISLYQNNVIRKIATTGIITTIAGNGTAAYTGNGGQATAASLNEPCKPIVDNNGNLYIADEYNFAIRKVTASTGIITTIAGTGVNGYSGDGGQATAAKISDCEQIRLDASGNLYIADKANNRVRKVDATGIITTIVGTGTAGYTGDGGLATAAEINLPQAIIFDANGALYFTDGSNNCVRKVSSPCPVSFSGVTSICSGTGTILTASGASSYTWSANAGSATTNTVNVSPTSNTTYTVSSSGATCVGTNTITVSVTTTPTLVVSGDTTLCSGNNTTLTASGATSYTWASSAFTVTTSSVNVSPTTDDTFTVTAANGNCMDVASVTIHVTPTPSLNINGATTICSGNSSILTASGATTYSWSANAGSATTNTVSINPSSNTTYSLIGANGICAVTNTINVTVNATPTLSIFVSPSNTICSGASTTISPSGATTYTLNPGNQTGTSFTVSPSSPTTYTINGTDAATGCQNQSANAALVSITVNSLPPSPIIVSPTAANNSYCQGHPNSLVVNSGINVAVWYNGNSVVNMGSVYTPSNNLPVGTYTYSVIDSVSTTGCVNASSTANTLTLSLTINPTPTLSLAGATIDTAMCGLTIGGVSGISASNITGGTPNYNYQWYNGSNAVSGGTSPSLSGVGAGTYSLHVADANGCVAVIVGGSPTFSVPATAAVAASFTTNPSTASGPAPLTVNFTNTSTGATSYIWIFGDGNTSTAVNPTHTYTTVNSYTASLVASNGSCRDTASIFIVSYVTGIQTISNNLHVDILPNPSNGIFTIETNATNKQMVLIFDINGKQVLSQIINGTTTIDVSNLSQGVYNLSVISSDGVVNKRLVIVK
jgi:PKD repeat protein